MLATLAESRDRVAVGVGLAVLLRLLGRGVGALESARRTPLAGRP